MHWQMIVVELSRVTRS